MEAHDHIEDMNISELDFNLPPSLIAQKPVEGRDQSRLLVINRRTKTLAHHSFFELPDLIPAGTWLFRNDAAVFKARLPGKRPSGGNVECLLLRPCPRENPAHNIWECLLRPGRKLRFGSVFGLSGHYSARVIEPASNSVSRVEIMPDSHGQSVLDLTEQIGSTPLPPYIRRNSKTPLRGQDTIDYQTRYADPAKRVAAAAPTAGLHFSDNVLSALKHRRHLSYNLTLHIGLGTFQPIKTDVVEEHPIHREYYEIPKDTREALEKAPNEGHPRLAVGTTAVRSIEDYFRHRTVDETGPYAREADLFLYPPSEFEGVDLLLTNFHLPRSTLLCLVAAFLSPGNTEGLPWLKEIYNLAVKEKYRFFSYGDAMLIL